MWEFNGGNGYPGDMNGGGSSTASSSRRSSFQVNSRPTFAQRQSIDNHSMMAGHSGCGGGLLPRGAALLHQRNSIDVAEMHLRQLQLAQLQQAAALRTLASAAAASEQQQHMPSILDQQALAQALAQLQLGGSFSSLGGGVGGAASPPLAQPDPHLLLAQLSLLQHQDLNIGHHLPSLLENEVSSSNLLPHLQGGFLSNDYIHISLSDPSALALALQEHSNTR